MQRATAVLESFLESCDARRRGWLREVVEGLRREVPEGLPAHELTAVIDRFVLRDDRLETRLVCQRLLNYLKRPRSRVSPRTASPTRDRYRFR